MTSSQPHERMYTESDNSCSFYNHLLCRRMFHIDRRYHIGFVMFVAIFSHINNNDNNINNYNCICIGVE